MTEQPEPRPEQQPEQQPRSRTGAEAQAEERRLEREDVAARSTSPGLDATDEAAGRGEDSVAARAAQVGSQPADGGGSDGLSAPPA